MPDIVTFDGPNKVITVIDDVGNTEMEVSAVEVYSEWKAWLQTNTENMKYLPAFSFVGGDPISPSQSLGITYFLENGWRIRPTEKDHKLTVVGNVFTREAGESIFLPTLGSFTVNTETRVSNLVDSSVSRLDLTQLLESVYVDPVNGESGTDTGSASVPAIGTPVRPSNNLSDAFDIAARDNLASFVIHGSVTLDRNVTNWRFEGLTSEFGNVIDLNGYDVDDCVFESMTLTGTMTGDIECRQCQLSIVQGLDGIFRNCGLLSSFTLDDDASATFIDCVSLVAGSNTPDVTVGTNVSLGFRNYSGGVRVHDMTDGCTISADLDPGHLIIDSSCIGGSVSVRGTGNLTDESNGAVTITDIGLQQIVSAHSALLYKRDTQQLDIAVWIDRNGTVLTPTGFTLTVFALDGTQVLSVDETDPGVTLVAAGWYAGTVSLSLSQEALYFAIVSVTDARGTITRTRAAISA